jgi:hypothetical protein
LRKPKDAGGRVGKLDQSAAAPSEKTLKGQKPHGRRCGKAVGFSNCRNIVKAMFLTQQLGAWVVSEEELKPKRGSGETLICFSGVWVVKTLKLNQQW